MKAVSQTKILVVDDNFSNRHLLKQALEQSGFEVLMASAGQQAITLVVNEQPTLILLDVMMPDMNGFEVCLYLKENLDKDIPIIFMTALANLESKLEGLSLGAVDYITKPFQIQEVLSRVNLHLKIRLLTQTLKEQNQNLQGEVVARRRMEAELYELTQQLEKRIEQRTEELSTALEKLRSREQQLVYQASHDLLTGLPNRRWFMDALKQCLERRTKQAVSALYGVLFIDLDHFKTINDSMGHLMGDKFLKKVALRLKKTLREIGEVARFGGDEFVVLLEDIRSTAEAEQVAQLILQELEQPFQVNGHEIFTSASIGIALSTTNYQKSADILRDADIAMYHAKHAGRGGYQMLTPKMQTSAIARWQLEQDLRQAIVKQEFSLRYQPIFLLATGELVGFEALIRWQHPTGDLVSPGEFIAVAEETGIIQEIDLWGLRTACQQMRQWQEQFQPSFPLFVNVNFSALQLRQSNLVEAVTKICQETNFPTTCLKLEITESCFLENSQREIKLLEELYERGVRICIDDFGTGYSSLSRLYSLPIHTLKVDQSFIHAIPSNFASREIARIIVSLAHSLGMDVVAEGIETPAHLDFLKAIGCDLGQGYFLSKPLNAQQVVQILRSNPVDYPCYR